MTTIDPDEGKDVPQPHNGGSEPQRGPWESEPDAVDPDEPGPGTGTETDPGAEEGDDGKSKSESEGESEGESGDSTMAPDRGPWE